MITYKKFLADGSTNRFLSDFTIRSEQFTRPYVYIFDNTLASDGTEDVLQDIGSAWSYPDNLYRRGADVAQSADLTTVDKWQVVDNSILYYVEPLANTTIWLEVATTAEEFGATLIQPSVARAEIAADEAAASAAAALQSETNSAVSETNSSASELSANSSETASSLSETNAAASAAAANVSAQSAIGSAGIAEGAAFNANISAGDASNSANNASFYKNEALTAATEALASKDAAAISAAEAAASAAAAASLEPTLAADLDTLTTSGNYYTDGTTLNPIISATLGTLDLILDYTQIDANSAIQRGINIDNNLSFFRAKVSGVWQNWYQITAAEFLTLNILFPVPSDDSVLYETTTSSITGWTGSTANFSSDGTSLILAAPGTPVGVDLLTTSFVTAGDYIMYATLSASATSSGNGINFQFGGVGDSAIIVSIGYNWETTSYQADVISARIGTTGVAGPVISGSAEVALQYDSRLGVGNFFIKSAGLWVFYGGASMAAPFKSALRIASGGNHAATGVVNNWFFARPNAALIGDSIAAGHTLYDPDPAYYPGVDDNYLSTWTGHSNMYSGLRNNLVVNYGIGGQNSLEIANRTAALMSNTSAKVIFLHASSNDYGAGFTSTQRTTNIQNTINTITTAGAEVVLLNAVYPNSGSAAYPANADFYKLWWDTNASTLTGGAYLIDIMTDSGILTGDYLNPIYTQVDGVHPNVAGFTLIGNLIDSSQY